MKKDEIKAMEAISEALDGLEDDAARKRVLRWALDAYVAGAAKAKPTPSPLEVDAPADSREFKKISDLFGAAKTSNQQDRVLVACYWFQELQGKVDFSGQAVNDELKHLGFGSKNITRDLDALKAKVPQLVLQTQKSGSSKQARKSYTLTEEGKRHVRRMLSSTDPLASPEVE